MSDAPIPARSSGTADAPSSPPGSHAVGALRFGCWVGVITAGMIALYLGESTACLLLLGPSGILLMPRRQLTAPLKPITTLLLLVVTVGSLAGMFAIGEWVDESGRPGGGVEFARHAATTAFRTPVGAAVIWLLIVGLGIRKWRHQLGSRRCPTGG